MGILRKLRQWQENADGTLEGPAVHTDRMEINDTTLFIQGTEPDADDDDIWIRNE